MQNIRPLFIPVIDFTYRSPYSFPTMNLPPAGRVAGGATVEVNEAGQPMVAGLTLNSYQSNTPANANPVAATYDQASFGDMQTTVAAFTGTGLPVDGNGNPVNFVVQRPPNQRTQMLIQNNTLGNLYYAFDKIADNTSCVLIPAGGQREFDSRVSQGALSLFAVAAGTAVVEYMNNNLVGS